MGSDTIVYLRTDGNSQIASGHIARCFSIAQAIQSLGHPVCFLVSDEDSRRLLENLGAFFPVRILSTAHYQNPESELPELTKLLAASGKKNILLIDSYFVTEHYLKVLSPWVKIAYIDDLQLFDYPVDLLINYDVIPREKLCTYQSSYSKASKTLLGSQYTPLRSQFQNHTKKPAAQVSHILITSGGSDPFYFCLQGVKAMLAALPGYIHYHIILGSFFQNKEEFYRLAQDNPYIHCYENVTDMAALMEQCDLAISAAGTTLYELCAIGIPSASFVFADNQLPTAKGFAQEGAVTYLGDLRQGLSPVLEKLESFCLEMMDDTVKRKSAHEAMHRLVDGNGALRIAKALITL